MCSLRQPQSRTHLTILVNIKFFLFLSGVQSLFGRKINVRGLCLVKFSNPIIFTDYVSASIKDSVSEFLASPLQIPMCSAK